MTRLYALTTITGTACAETTLTEKDYHDDEVRLATEDDRLQDVTLTWAEVTDNQACQEWLATDQEMQA